jgi:hypothetical protein
VVLGSFQQRTVRGTALNFVHLEHFQLQDNRRSPIVRPALLQRPLEEAHVQFVHQVLLQAHQVNQLVLFAQMVHILSMGVPHVYPAQLELSALDHHHLVQAVSLGDISLLGANLSAIIVLVELLQTQQDFLSVLLVELESIPLGALLEALPASIAQLDFTQTSLLNQIASHVL